MSDAISAVARVSLGKQMSNVPAPATGGRGGGGGGEGGGGEGGGEERQMMRKR